eukprot:6174174-Pleurochrysis_carterae.AAC.1
MQPLEGTRNRTEGGLNRTSPLRPGQGGILEQGKERWEVRRLQAVCAAGSVGRRRRYSAAPEVQGLAQWPELGLTKGSGQRDIEVCGRQGRCRFPWERSDARENRGARWRRRRVPTSFFGGVVCASGRQTIETFAALLCIDERFGFVTARSDFRLPHSSSRS